MNNVQCTVLYILVKGRNFHHKQARRRNLQEKGLVGLITQSSKLEYLVQMVYVLAYVPPLELARSSASHTGLCERDWICKP